MYLEEIGENIRRYRKQKSYTQEQLAQKVGVTWEMISKYERAESNPMRKLVELSDALEVPAYTLLGGPKVSEIPLLTDITEISEFIDRGKVYKFYSPPKWIAHMSTDVVAVDTAFDSGFTDFQGNELLYVELNSNPAVSSSKYFLTQTNGRIEISTSRVDSIGMIIASERRY